MKTITIYVQPGAKRTRVVGLHDGLPKIAVHAPPVEGAANAALLAYLAELGQVSKTSMKIISGSSSRTKKVSVSDEAYARLQDLLFPGGES